MLTQRSVCTDDPGVLILNNNSPTKLTKAEQVLPIHEHDNSEASFIRDAFIRKHRNPDGFSGELKNAM